MTTDYSYSLSSLAQILSALEGERRNPNTKRNAIKAIERAASRLGLDSDDVFDAADGLLSGLLDAAAWRSSLGGGKPADALGEAAADNTGSASDIPQYAAEVGHDGTGDEDTVDVPMPNAEALAVTPRRPTGTRAGSKQAMLIGMLRREEGATIEQIAEAMEWARHTCRGAISGALKKKLGLTITSEKSEGGTRVYRIAE